MKKGIISSISLILLGLFFECLHFTTNLEFFQIKFWALGLITMTLGVLGLIWFTIVPLLEKRASTIGRFKGKEYPKTRDRYTKDSGWIHKNEFH